MSSPPAPAIMPEADRCAATTDAGVLDAKLSCSLRAGHDHGVDATEHEAWALPGDDGYVGKPQILATWPGGGSVTSSRPRG